MRKIIFLVLFILPVNIQAQGANTAATVNHVKTVTSPANRVVLLELYTSEGCSSCPPADRFLSALKADGISKNQLIPMAFHVTYWDYIGWQDHFANELYDQRQREMALKRKKSTVYTPQFLLSGDDYRSFARFNNVVKKMAMQKATVDLILSAHVISDQPSSDKLQLTLDTNISASEIKDVGFYLVVMEHNLVTDVSDGENNGRRLHHDYVVRQLLGPYFQSQPKNQMSQEQIIRLKPEWKRQDLSIVAFAENPHTGEILQAVKLDF
jgi:hypothetical protein